MRRSLFLYLLTLLGSCQPNPNKQTTLTIQASSTPQAELLAYIQKDLEQEGITLRILVIDDYNIPNRALAEKEIDANFFQHLPFLEEQKKHFGYPLIPLLATHIEPLGIYSATFPSLTLLPPQAKIAIPNDPTNETRALLLLEQAGLIGLPKDKESSLTIVDIQENPYSLRFIELDAAFLSRTLTEVGAAVIPTNYALLAGLHPQTDALYLESTHSPYANVIVIREKEKQDPRLEALKKHMSSPKMRAHIQETYQGAIIPASSLLQQQR